MLYWIIHHWCLPWLMTSAAKRGHWNLCACLQSACWLCFSKGLCSTGTHPPISTLHARQLDTSPQNCALAGHQPQGPSHVVCPGRSLSYRLRLHQESHHSHPVSKNDLNITECVAEYKKMEFFNRKSTLWKHPSLESCWQFEVAKQLEGVNNFNNSFLCSVAVVEISEGVNVNVKSKVVKQRIKFFLLHSF